MTCRAGSGDVCAAAACGNHRSIIVLEMDSFFAKRCLLGAFLFLAMSAVRPGSAPLAQDFSDMPDPAGIVEGAIRHWQGESSFMRLSMTVHRADWERTIGMESVTRGEKDALVRFTAPPKDAGNATLKLGRDMWIYLPRLGQVTKLPSSMMAQSWGGSDFSYNDLARSDRILEDYDFTLLDVQPLDGHDVYLVEALPRPAAPVVWGREVLHIRDDMVLLEHRFYAQDGSLVRRMRAEEVGMLDGRPYPMRMRMENVEEEGRWTLLVTEEGGFDVEPPNFLFTRSNLSEPRSWTPQ